MAANSSSSQFNEFPPIKIEDNVDDDDEDDKIVTSSVTVNALKNNNNIKYNRNNNNTSSSKTSANCKCTNISIMQLFHEMKQKFPKVPDHIVTQCVSENCHNRDACIDNLVKESQKLLGTQVYPAQSLHPNLNNNNSSGGVGRNFINRNNSEQQQLLNNNNNKLNDMPLNSELNKTSSSSSLESSSSQPSNNLNSNAPAVPQRPNTLKLLPQNPPTGSFYRSTSNHRPTRSAPPPPQPQQTQQSHTTIQQQQSQSQSSSSLSSAATSPTSSSYHPHNSIIEANHSVIPSQNDSFVSVNVTVSPVSVRPPPRPPRHTTALNIQPESPRFFRDPQQAQPKRSFTSVHFDVRPLTDQPHAPINITAGPSLTYSSSSFDARQGHQNQLQVTIESGCGSVSAMRIRPRNFVQNNSLLSSDFEDNHNNMMGVVPACNVAAVPDVRPPSEGEFFF